MPQGTGGAVCINFLTLFGRILQHFFFAFRAKSFFYGLYIYIKVVWRIQHDNNNNNISMFVR